MMVMSSYRILAFVIGLSSIKGVFNQMHFRRSPTTEDVPSEKLAMDEAYLIMSNMNNSNTSVFLANAVICEGCDLEEIGMVSPGSNVTIIINTQYAYDFEVRSVSSNALLQCHLTSYKFAEHGIYLFKVIPRTEEGNDIEVCSIVQIGESSHYWSPVIIGLVIWIAFVIIIELCCHMYRSRDFDRSVWSIFNRWLMKKKWKAMPLINSLHSDTNRSTVHITSRDESLPLIESDNLSNKTIDPTPVISKRFQALDSFRGFALMVMIFVEYNGGGYWFFNHAIWNGLNLADVAFPWFIWLIGFSIVLSQRSLRTKKIRKCSILFKICRRTATLFLLGLISDDGKPMLENFRAFSVLQRLALCYFFTALIVLFVVNTNDELDTTGSAIGGKIKRHWRIDLFNCVLRFWLQWLCVILIIVAWLLITFFINVPNCPKGYLGPGGKHEHGKYQNCTGGANRYVDQLILTDSHMGRCWTCRHIYDTELPFESEGILGTLTGILLCYIGAQAGHSYIHSTSVRRVCTHWFIAGIICGSLGLLLSKGGHFDGWIPINKNLWSLSFVLVVASLSFIMLIIFYLAIDIRQWLTGAPFIWLGMNAIVIYMGLILLANRFPVQFAIEKTHAKLMAMSLYGVFLWTAIAGLMYWKKVFIVI